MGRDNGVQNTKLMVSLPQTVTSIIWCTMENNYLGAHPIFHTWGVQCVMCVLNNTNGLLDKFQVITDMVSDAHSALIPREWITISQHPLKLSTGCPGKIT